MSWDAFAHAEGFTLLELLIVIAIIAILALLVTPAVSRSISAAQSMKCVGNLRQVYTASTLWSADNNGRIPPMHDTYPKTIVYEWQDERSTLGILAPYLGHDSTNDLQSSAEIPVFVCPSNPKQWGYGLNYLYLSWPLHSFADPQWRTFAGMAGRLGGLSKVVFFCDNEWAADNGKPGSDFNNWRSFVRPPSFGYNYMDVRPSFRHPGKTCNVLWLDGHVSSEKITGPWMNPSDTYWGSN